MFDVQGIAQNAAIATFEDGDWLWLSRGTLVKRFSDSGAILYI
ncbi:hypothetical protein OAJ57_02520 [Alphaproteobacteria bacterium]|nr:hypothetical protein [Alphaproteobacteria bacterium]